MTYKQFIRLCLAGQARYIREERRRYTKARALWDKYQAAMHDLGLHPLSREEIRDRFDHLRRMEAEINETHGDTPVNRDLYRARVGTPS
jgi:Tat protein secretion system quality control protein TatD with DNase activity